MLPQHGGHLARLDPEPADLDLIVEPPRYSKDPSARRRTWSPVRYIRCPGTVMSGHEGPGRGRRVAQVAARHAGAGQAHLAGLAVRHRIEAVEHVAAHAIDGKPDRRRHRAAGQHG